MRSSRGKHQRLRHGGARLHRLLIPPWSLLFEVRCDITVKTPHPHSSTIFQGLGGVETASRASTCWTGLPAAFGSCEQADQRTAKFRAPKYRGAGDKAPPVVRICRQQTTVCRQLGAAGEHAVIGQVRLTCGLFRTKHFSFGTFCCSRSPIQVLWLQNKPTSPSLHHRARL